MPAIGKRIITMHASIANYDEIQAYLDKTRQLTADACRAVDVLSEHMRRMPIIEMALEPEPTNPKKEAN